MTTRRSAVLTALGALLAPVAVIAKQIVPKGPAWRCLGSETIAIKTTRWTAVGKPVEERVWYRFHRVTGKPPAGFGDELDVAVEHGADGKPVHCGTRFGDGWFVNH